MKLSNSLQMCSMLLFNEQPAPVRKTVQAWDDISFCLESQGEPDEH